MFTAYIPIKLVSERIKNKNFLNINGKPLFKYVIENLLDIDLIDEILINYDAEEVKDKISEHFENIKFVKRLDNMMDPKESVNKLISSDLDNIKNEFIIQTHVTNPMVSKNTFVDALNCYMKNKKALFSVTEHRSRFYSDELKEVNHDMKILLPTQELNPIFEENSNFYVFSKNQFLRNDLNRISKNSDIFKVSKFESFDIDTYEDLELVKLLICSKH